MIKEPDVVKLVEGSTNSAVPGTIELFPGSLQPENLERCRAYILELLGSEKDKRSGFLKVIANMNSTQVGAEEF